jgi:DNA-binding transcriptional regulator YiaG
MMRVDFKIRAPRPATIRKARHRLGLTQTEAGFVINAKLRTWQDWESGRRNMPAIKWAWWCQVTGY